MRSFQYSVHLEILAYESTIALGPNKELGPLNTSDPFYLLMGASCP